MAEIDYLIASWITRNSIYFVFAALIYWVINRRGKDLRHRWFAYFMHLLTKEKNVKSEEVKKDLFRSLSTVVSHDPQLRKESKIKILEIGVGTGVNFSHYPDGTQLIVVDPNPHFVKYYNENRKKFPNIASEEIIVTTGTVSSMISVPDASVDVVVMTLVMCSVSEIEAILREILRVLVPGGKFYFLEHIREFDPKKHFWRQKIQDFLTSCRLWPFLFDGCCLNRDMLPYIEKAGFSKVNGERFYAPISNILLYLIKPQLKGIAEK
ncbi:thiol S-methyltransferase TMT1A-like [Macrobrachium nipponense]|uniref:thiol S-methyltransferase TMT1A-like n=1 Tax=Macrobrachium nipponense TaxID=159736 RepID=UPI0030C7C4D7